MNKYEIKNIVDDLNKNKEIYLNSLHVNLPYIKQDFLKKIDDIIKFDIQSNLFYEGCLLSFLLKTDLIKFISVDKQLFLIEKTDLIENKNIEKIYQFVIGWYKKNLDYINNKDIDIKINNYTKYTKNENYFYHIFAENYFTKKSYHFNWDDIINKLDNNSDILHKLFDNADELKINDIFYQKNINKHIEKLLFKNVFWSALGYYNSYIFIDNNLFLQNIKNLNNINIINLLNLIKKEFVLNFEEKKFKQITLLFKIVEKDLNEKDLKNLSYLKSLIEKKQIEKKIHIQNEKKVKKNNKI